MDDIFKALANTYRRKIIKFLLNMPKLVKELQDDLNIRQSLVSTHLAILLKANLVSYSQIGNQRRYFLSDLNLKLLKSAFYELWGFDIDTRPRARQ